jgi:hypothetical protein
MKSPTASNLESDRPAVRLSPALQRKMPKFIRLRKNGKLLRSMSNRVRQRQFTSLVFNNFMNLEENLCQPQL